MAEQQLNLSVELRPHIGKRNTPLGVIDVEHDQWLVIVARNGLGAQQVGILPKRDGAPLLWLTGIPAAIGTWMKQQIEKAVDLERSRIVGNAAVASLPQKGDPFPATEE